MNRTIAKRILCLYTLGSRVEVFTHACARAEKGESSGCNPPSHNSSHKTKELHIPSTHLRLIGKIICTIARQSEFEANDGSPMLVDATDGMHHRHLVDAVELATRATARAPSRCKAMQCHVQESQYARFAALHYKFLQTCQLIGRVKYMTKSLLHEQVGEGVNVDRSDRPTRMHKYP